MKWHSKLGMRYSPWMKWNLFHFIYSSWSRCPTATVENTWCRWHLLVAKTPNSAYLILAVHKNFPVCSFEIVNGRCLTDIADLRLLCHAFTCSTDQLFNSRTATVIHQLMLHQKLKVHLKHDGETFSLKNWTFSLGDLRSLSPPNFRALGFVAVE